MRTRQFVLSFTAITIALFSATSVRAETTGCVAIASIPATIANQGIYCLHNSVSMSNGSGNAITITANNVTLDLNGWKVGGQAAGTGTLAVGVFGTGNNVTVKIYLDGKGSVIEDNIVSGLAATGNGFEYSIYLSTSADQSVVRRNIVSDDARPGGTGSSYAVEFYGATDVIGVENSMTSFDYGIIFIGAASGTYSRNIAVNCDMPYFGGTAGSNND